MLILFAIENQDVTGPLNAVAPWPVRNRELTATLARTLRRPAWVRAPAWALRLALNDFSRELLDSKRVVPAAATTHGFRFKHPELAPALKDLLG
jgi:NAD dependent epimerase/dehydratase family enzyme